jgi:hypothetical protein
MIENIKKELQEILDPMNEETRALIEAACLYAAQSKVHYIRFQTIRDESASLVFYDIPEDDVRWLLAKGMISEEWNHQLIHLTWKINNDNGANLPHERTGKQAGV